MRLYSNEFKFNMVLHEELCKREYTAMVIKTMKPDPVEFKLTVNSWLSHTFRDIKVFDYTLEGLGNWQEAMSKETLVTIIIERLRPHMPTLMTMYDIDKDHGHPWTADTLKAFLQRMNKDNWKSAVTFRPFEVTPTLSQRFTPHAPPMKAPNTRSHWLQESCNTLRESMTHATYTQLGTGKSKNCKNTNKKQEDIFKSSPTDIQEY